MRMAVLQPFSRPSGASSFLRSAFDVPSWTREVVQQLCNMRTRPVMAPGHPVGIADLPIRSQILRFAPCLHIAGRQKAAAGTSFQAIGLHMDMGGSEMHAYDYRKKGKMTTKRRLQQCMRHRRMTMEGERILSWPSHVSRCDLVTGPIVVYSDSEHKVDK